MLEFGKKAPDFERTDILKRPVDVQKRCWVDCNEDNFISG